MLLAGQRMVAADHEHGALDQMISAGLAPSLIAAGKMCLQFIAIGLPLSLASFPLGLQYGLSGETLVLLAGSMALGLVSLSALSALFSALGLMARQAQIAVSMASLPCFVPVLIFGSAVAQSAQAGLSAEAPLMVLAALAVLSVIALPVVAARVLMLAVD
jgi:heme exporter protein B